VLLKIETQSPVPFSLRLLGYASLCGVLHVAYRSTHEVLGDFMLCALFKSHLLLASPRPGMSSFEIVAIISINDVHLEKADNGKGDLHFTLFRHASAVDVVIGLQCYTAPFSWKLIFESDQLLYEIILCACTVREEEQWKASIQEHAIKGNQVGAKGSPILNLLSFEHSVLCLDIKPLGPVFGLPGTLMRRQSIQRAATTNHRRHACQIIIKNTFSLKETGESPMKRSGTLSRSRSLLSTHHIPVLAPRRVDRQRMEQKMSDVWTKDRLPYPGMAGHRGGHLIRTSATTVMRKISFASPTNPISSLERRTTTSGSMGDGKSDLTSFERVLENQTDGTSSPMPEYTHTPLNAIDSTLEYQDPNPYSKCTFLTPEEGAIDLAEDDDQTDVQDESMSRQVSEVSTVVASRDSKELYHEKGKPSKPKTLLKAFSTESIRGWFH